MASRTPGWRTHPAATTIVAVSARRSLLDRYLDAVRRTPEIVDAMLAVVVVLVALDLMTSGHVPRADWGPTTAVAIGFGLPVVVRRRFPMPAAVVTAAGAALVMVLLPGATDAILLPVLVMGYSAVAYGPRWAGPLTAGVILLGALIPTLRVPAEAPPQLRGVTVFLAVIGLLVGVCTWLAGALRRAQRRSYAEAVERTRLLEEGRRQEVRLELLAERSRISREVHDIVAHSLSGIIAQADGGQLAATRDPARAVEVLDGIAAAGREALGDIRGLLSMLRDTAPVDDLDDTDRPQPGVGDVPALVAQVRAGGLPATFERTGTPGDLATGAGLAVYRVVQEALTNVVKHAGPTTPTRVTLDWGRDELTVVVRDEGPHGPVPALPRGGHGLVGMRERAALHGGSVETGPHDGGGFAVRLRLPLAPARSLGSAIPG